jgi:hypothetical protein
METKVLMRQEDAINHMRELLLWGQARKITLLELFSVISFTKTYLQDSLHIESMEMTNMETEESS